jgi:Tol biopolymer transport system component
LPRLGIGAILDAATTPPFRRRATNEEARRKVARRSSILFGSLTAISALAVAVSSPAQATFPGRSGVLAFSAYSLAPTDEFVYDRRVVGVAPIGAAPRLFGAGSSPAFSPGAGKIAYAGEHGSIWVARPNCRWQKPMRRAPACSRVQRLTRGASDDSPAWLPSGKRIAFVRRSNRIFTVRARGGGPRFLRRGHDPDWSSTGALAFRGNARIHVQGPGGRTRNLGVRGWDPNWAPSGDRLAFAAADGIYTINADGTELRKIWSNRKEGSPFDPVWSPDGRSIAFIGAGDDYYYNGPVYLIRPSGEGARVLMRQPRCWFCYTDEGVSFDQLSWQALR